MASCPPARDESHPATPPTVRDPGPPSLMTQMLQADRVPLEPGDDGRAHHGRPQDGEVHEREPVLCHGLLGEQGLVGTGDDDVRDSEDGGDRGQGPRCPAAHLASLDRG
jgi:hypothetical protein